jgi:hypothetical protein
MELFLQKLAENAKNTNTAELYFLLEIFSKSMENFEGSTRGSEKESAAINDIYPLLLRTITEKIWHVFYKKIAPQALEQLIQTVSEASLILSVNGSFLHILEIILLQLYPINGDITDRNVKNDGTLIADAPSL